MRSNWMAAPIAAMAFLSTAVDAGLSEAQQKEAAARVETARQIVARYEAEARAKGHAAGWRIDMMNALLATPSSMLGSMASEANLSQREMMQKARSAKGVGTKALGDRDIDLVYFPITPCRLADTRNWLGPIAGGTARGIAEESSGTQGGDPGCSATIVALGSDHGAYAVNLTVLNMSTTGFVALRPVGATQLTSIVNFIPGAQVNNFGIVQNNNNSGDEFEVFASASVNVIVDVFGVFRDPTPTALDCTTVTVANAGFLGLQSASCAAGRTMTGGGCASNKITDHIWSNGPSDADTWSCGFWPESGETIGGTLTAHAVCCRTP